VAIAEDGSTPVPVKVTGTSGACTTASFTPPVGSLLVALVAGGWGSGSLMDASVTDSVGGTWAAGPNAQGTSTSARGVAKIFTRYLTTAPGAMTVSATFTNLGGGRMLAVRVVTGAASSQVGAGSNTRIDAAGSTNGALTVPLTVAGSWVYGISDNCSINEALTPNAATSILTNGDYNDTTDTVRLVAWCSANPTTAGNVGTSPTFGGTWPAVERSNTAALEVLPSTSTPISATLAATSSLTAGITLPAGVATLSTTAILSSTIGKIEGSGVLSATASLIAGAAVPAAQATLIAAASLATSVIYINIAAAGLSAVSVLSGITVPPTTMAAGSVLITSGLLLPAVIGGGLAAISGLTVLGFGFIPVGAQLNAQSSFTGELFTTWADAANLCSIASLDAGVKLPGAGGVLTAVAQFNLTGPYLVTGGSDLVLLVVSSRLVANADSYRPVLVIPTGGVYHPTQTPQYRLYAADTRTGRIGWELPFESIQWNTPINAVGQLRASLVIEDALDQLASIGSLDPRATLREVLTGPYRISLVLAWGNAVVFAGPYLPGTIPGDTPKIDIGASELARIFDKRVLTDPSGSLSLGPTSPGDMVKQIIESATSQLPGSEWWRTGRELPITCSNPPSIQGSVTRFFQGFDTVSATEAINSIVTQEDGPDFRLDPYLQTGRDGLYVAWELNIGNPHLGASSDPWVFDDSNSLISQDIDAARMASMLFVPGSGQDDKKLMSWWVDNQLVDQGFPALEEVDTSQSSVADQTVLDSYASASLDRYLRPVDKWTVKTRADGEPGLGSYRVGDAMLLDIRRHPIIIPDVYTRRITEISGDASPWVSLASTELL
jgi:hypothetical protein